MLPTSDQDTNSSNATGVTSHTKLSQKAASAGLQIPTKNGRKNVTAKDSGGGVMAAVTKNKM